MKIAIVDDDYTARTLIQEFLEDEGFDTEAAKHPEELKNVDTYDVIIMDVMIQTRRHAGIEFILEQLENNNLNPTSKVIFISNFGKETGMIQDLLRRVGEYIDFEWLNKPIEFADLEERIRKYQVKE